MPIIEHRTDIRTTQAAAFHAAQDYEARAQWDPFFAGLAVIPSEGGPRRVKVTAWHGATMEVEFVAWFPPERAAIRMVSESRWLAVFAGSWAFLPRDGGKVEVRFRYQVTPKPRWAWLGPLMRAYFGWETRRRLSALKRYLESRPVE